MSWDELIGSDIVKAHSPVESDSLGLSTARIQIPRNAEIDADSVVNAVVGMNADLTVVRAPSNHMLLRADLIERLPQHLVLHADTLLYWQLDTNSAESRDDEAAVRPELELETLDTLVQDTFAGYENHYSANPRTRSVNVGRAYADWAVRHVGSGLPYCHVEVDGRTAGVATLAVAAGHLEILLAGIASEFRGRGVYRRLLEAVAGEARRRRIESVYISTQAQNIKVQRSWARFGFVPAAAFDTMHVMRHENI